MLPIEHLLHPNRGKHVLFCPEFNFVIVLTGAGANLLNGNSRSNDKRKNVYLQKILGSWDLRLYAVNWGLPRVEKKRQ